MRSPDSYSRRPVFQIFLHTSTMGPTLMYSLQPVTSCINMSSISVASRHFCISAFHIDDTRCRHAGCSIAKHFYETSTIACCPGQSIRSPLLVFTANRLYGVVRVPRQCGVGDAVLQAQMSLRAGPLSLWAHVSLQRRGKPTARRSWRIPPRRCRYAPAPG